MRIFQLVFSLLLYAVSSFAADLPISVRSTNGVAVGITLVAPTTNSSLTASKILILDSLKRLTNSTTDAVQLLLLQGVTSDIQTQLDAKALQSNLTIVSNLVLGLSDSKLNTTNPSGVGNFTMTAGVGTFQFQSNQFSPNLTIGHQLNTNQAEYASVILGGGTEAEPNQILWSGSAFSGIIGGYGVTVAGLASSVVFSPHSINYSGHGSIVGGSFGLLKTNTSYSGIFSGTLNTIWDGSDLSVIIGGDNQNADGGYATIVGGRQNTVTNQFGTIIGGDRNTVSGNGGFLIGGKSNVVAGAGSWAIGGDQINISGPGLGVIKATSGVMFEGSRVGINGTNGAGVIPSSLAMWPASSRDYVRLMTGAYGTTDNAAIGIVWQNAGGVDSNVLSRESSDLTSATELWKFADAINFSVLNLFAIGNGTGTNAWFRNSSAGLGLNLGHADSLANSIARRPITGTGGLTRTYAWSDGAQASTYWGGEAVQNPARTSSSFLGVQTANNVTHPWGSAVTGGEVVYSQAANINFFAEGNSFSTMLLSTAGNVGLAGAKTFGSSAVGNLALKLGTGPSSRPGDIVSIWAGDQNGDGTASLFIGGEGSPITSTSIGSQRLITGGGRKIARSAQSGDHSVQLYEHEIFVSATSTQTLLTAAAEGAGGEHVIASGSGATVTIARQSGDTINGVAASYIVRPKQAVRIVSDGGTNFEVTGTAFPNAPGLGPTFYDPVVRPTPGDTDAVINFLGDDEAGLSGTNFYGALSFERASVGPLQSQLSIKLNSGDASANVATWTTAGLLISADFTALGVIKDSGASVITNGLLGASASGLLSEYKLLKAGTNAFLDFSVPGEITINSAASGGGGTSVYANGASVSNPNFADTATALVVVAASTNIGIYPTNIANAQISASAAIAASKLAPPGSDTYLIFNDGGAFGADSGLTYNKTTDSITAAGTIASSGGPMQVPAGNFFQFGTTRAKMRSAADGAFEVRDSAQTSMAYIQGNVATVTKTSSYTISALDGGKVFSNLGTSAKVPFTLPPAVANFTTTILVQDTDGVDVISVGDDTIQYGSTTSGTAATITSTASGSWIELTALSATQWFAEIGGTWTP